MHIIRLFFIFGTHQFISCFRLTLKAILLGGWKILKNFWRWETCRRAWVFLQDYMRHYDISFFLSFLKPTNDELVVHSQYMTYHRFCLEYFHNGLQVLEMFKQTDCDLWPDCGPLAGASLSRRLLVYTYRSVTSPSSH